MRERQDNLTELMRRVCQLLTNQETLKGKLTDVPRHSLLRGAGSSTNHAEVTCLKLMITLCPFLPLAISFLMLLLFLPFLLYFVACIFSFCLAFRHPNQVSLSTLNSYWFLVFGFDRIVFPSPLLPFYIKHCIFPSLSFLFLGFLLYILFFATIYFQSPLSPFPSLLSSSPPFFPPLLLHGQSTWTFSFPHSFPSVSLSLYVIYPVSFFLNFTLSSCRFYFFILPSSLTLNSSLNLQLDLIPKHPRSHSCDQ